VKHDLVIIHEHPEWQKPLFAALERRHVNYGVFDLKSAAFADWDAPQAPLYFNQASPSAYVRGNTRAVPLGLSFMRCLEAQGIRVLNGSNVFAFELSKSAQAATLRALGITGPRSITFNDVTALRRRAAEMTWPALLKPEQGGSGARIQVVQSVDEVETLLGNTPALWEPDNLFLLQELLPNDPAHGSIRMEFLDGKLLYAMRVISHGRYNLCPAPVCNPEDGEAGICEIPATPQKPVEFYPYPEVPQKAVQEGLAIIKAAGIDVGGIEYMDTTDGRRAFYDINANSNLRPSIAQSFGFDPFERVVDFLVEQIGKTRPGAQPTNGAHASA